MVIGYLWKRGQGFNSIKMQVKTFLSRILSSKIKILLTVILCEEKEGKRKKCLRNWWTIPKLNTEFNLIIRMCQSTGRQHRELLYKQFRFCKGLNLRFSIQIQESPEHDRLRRLNLLKKWMLLYAHLLKSLRPFRNKIL